MLIEFDTLFAVFALMLVLPVAASQIMGNQNIFMNSSRLFSEMLSSNSNVQELAFQLNEMKQAQLPYLAGNRSYGYSFLPYNPTPTAYAQNAAYSRLVVAGGSLYYLQVKR